MLASLHGDDVNLLIMKYTIEELQQQPPDCEADAQAQAANSPQRRSTRLRPNLRSTRNVRNRRSTGDRRRLTSQRRSNRSRTRTTQPGQPEEVCLLPSSPAPGPPVNQTDHGQKESLDNETCAVGSSVDIKDASQPISHSGKRDPQKLQKNSSRERDRSRSPLRGQERRAHQDGLRTSDGVSSPRERRVPLRYEGIDYTAADYFQQDSRSDGLRTSDGVSSPRERRVPLRYEGVDYTAADYFQQDSRSDGLRTSDGVSSPRERREPLRYAGVDYTTADYFQQDSRSDGLRASDGVSSPRERRVPLRYAGVDYTAADYFQQDSRSWYGQRGPENATHADNIHRPGSGRANHLQQGMPPLLELMLILSKCPDEVHKALAEGLAMFYENHTHGQHPGIIDQQRPTRTNVERDKGAKDPWAQSNHLNIPGQGMGIRPPGSPSLLLGLRDQTKNITQGCKELEEKLEKTFVYAESRSEHHRGTVPDRGHAIGQMGAHQEQPRLHSGTLDALREAFKALTQNCQELAEGLEILIHIEQKSPFSTTEKQPKGTKDKLFHKDTGRRGPTHAQTIASQEWASSFQSRPLSPQQSPRHRSRSPDRVCEVESPEPIYRKEREYAKATDKHEHQRPAGVKEFQDESDCSDPRDRPKSPGPSRVGGQHQRPTLQQEVQKSRATSPQRPCGEETIEDSICCTAGATEMPHADHDRRGTKAEQMQEDSCPIGSPMGAGSGRHKSPTTKESMRSKSPSAPLCCADEEMEAEVKSDVCCLDGGMEHATTTDHMSPGGRRAQASAGVAEMHQNQAIIEDEIMRQMAMGLIQDCDEEEAEKLKRDARYTVKNMQHTTKHQPQRRPSSPGYRGAGSHQQRKSVPQEARRGTPKGSEKDCEEEEEEEDKDKCD